MNALSIYLAIAVIAGLAIVMNLVFDYNKRRKAYRDWQVWPLRL